MLKYKMYKTFLICLLVSYVSSAFDEPTFRKDYKYYEDVNGWIKLHRVPANWHDARLRCRAEGGSLASPSNSNMLNVMLYVIIAESTDFGIGIYSGIHSTFSNGSYSTIEGAPVSALPVNWAMGQPKHVNMENCVILHINGTLENVRCADEFKFICYKKFEPLTMNKCNTVDNEYVWDGSTGHCYKFHGYGQTWSRAHMICTAEGGNLAVINSDKEAEVVRDVFTKYPSEKIFARNNEFALIGIREWPDENSWYTVHGQTLNEAGYQKWSSGEPNNYLKDGETQDCGAIYKSALLDDVFCSQPLPFICEIDPEFPQEIY